ncbi:transposase [Streptomyces asiaticus]|uniref:transposase n=1 Tax=Streptomyces asiaticus TaxID=114695 RepID=UPI00381F0899
MLFRAQLYGLAQADSAITWATKNCATPATHAAYPIRYFISTFSRTVHVRTGDHARLASGTPTSPRARGRADPTSSHVSGLHETADRAVFRNRHHRQLPQVERALGRQAAALIRQVDAACTSVAQLAAATEEAFLAHPDAEIITSFPGLSVLSGARVLAEIGDDRERFADARAMKAYAGAAPVTRASGRSHLVVARTVKNQRLASAGGMWAFAALRTQAPRAHYDRRRAGGERHTAALRNLFSKLLGRLYHCLQRRTLFDPDRASTRPWTSLPEHLLDPPAT